MPPSLSVTRSRSMSGARCCICASRPPFCGPTARRFPAGSSPAARVARAIVSHVMPVKIFEAGPLHRFGEGRAQFGRAGRSCRETPAWNLAAGPCPTHAGRRAATGSRGSARRFAVLAFFYLNRAGVVVHTAPLQPQDFHFSGAGRQAQGNRRVKRFGPAGPGTRAVGRRVRPPSGSARVPWVPSCG